MIIGGGSNNPDWKKLVHDVIIHDTHAVLTLTATDNSVAINFCKNGTNEVLSNFP